MTKINKYLKRFEMYQNGDLSPEELKDFIRSLKEDREMQTAWEEYLSMMDAFSDKEAVSLRETLEKTFSEQNSSRVRSLSQNIWLKASVAAIVIITMGALLYFLCSNEAKIFNAGDQHMMAAKDSTSMDRQEPKNIQVQDSSVINNKVKEEVVFENKVASIYDNEEYQINPVYAQLLNSRYRGDWFTLKSPHNDSIMFSPGDSLLFSWETNIMDSLYFDILDRNGQVVYKHESSIISPWVFTDKLEPAIYMYRIATEDEPVFLGVMVGIE